MSDKDPRAPGARWLTPYLVVADIDASLDFYARAFGFTAGTTLPGPDGALMHAEMDYQGKPVVMMMPTGTWGSTLKPPGAGGFDCPISLYLYCEDVDALFEQALTAGATPLRKPEDMFWGDRSCGLQDRDGYVWSFATNFGEFDPGKLPF